LVSQLGQKTMTLANAFATRGKLIEIRCLPGGLADDDISGCSNSSLLRPL
jgi:hypothetical protein